MPIFSRALAALPLVILVTVLAPSNASAHADVESTSPRNGAQLASAPAAITFAFHESVRLAGHATRVTDGEGRRVQAKVVASGTTITITPRSALPAGRYAATWNVISQDGDEVTGSIAFTVDQPNPLGPSVPVATRPTIPSSLSTGMPGSRTLTMQTAARSGAVEWRNAAVPGPITWMLSGDGRIGSARGVLPTAGRWTFRATLDMRGGGLVIVTGSVTLAG